LLRLGQFRLFFQIIEQAHNQSPKLRKYDSNARENALSSSITVTASANRRRPIIHGITNCASDGGVCEWVTGPYILKA
jgi:hypothetical protein